MTENMCFPSSKQTDAHRIKSGKTVDSPRILHLTVLGLSAYVGNLAISLLRAIPLPRKEALMGKLNAFAAEVDRDRTRFEAFGALMIEAANVGAKVEKKLRPIRRWIDSIASVMHEAREIEDTRPGLLSPDKRIQAPTKQIAPPSGGLWAPQDSPKSGDDLDDEIPF